MHQQAPAPAHTLSSGRAIALWAILVVIFGAVVQAIAIALGSEMRLITQRTGNGVLGILMIAAAVVVMSRAHRPLSTYGLAIADHWQRRFAKGFLLGAAVIAAYAAVALATLAFRPGDDFTFLNTLEAAFEALGAIPLGVMATLVYAGFLLGLLRERFSPLTASIIAALLFAALYPGIPSADSWQSAASLAGAEFLVLIILAAARLRSGDIALPAGLFIGGLYVERFVRKTDLLAEQANPALANLFAPDQYFLTGPAIWPVLLIAAIYAQRLLHLRGEPAPNHTIATSFKRTYPFATMSALAPIDLWLRELARLRFKVDPPYIPRLIATLTLSTFNTALTLPERLLLPLILRRKQIPPPIFILGIHRSGTTHLQNLLSLDPGLATPTTWQVMNPHGFLASGHLIKPIVAGFMPWKRPMDAVRFGPDAPNEEEFALANMTGLSPDWSLRFPRAADHYDRFCYPDRMTETERTRLRRALRAFLRRFSARNPSKRPLLKNPWNTARLSLLLDMFPGAKVIHLRRDPVDVFRSNMHMTEEGHALIRLQDLPPREQVERRFLDNYQSMECAYYDAAQNLPDHQHIDIRYEDLVTGERETIRRIYNHLGLEYTTEFDIRLTAYLTQIRGYRKNRHRAVDDEKQNTIRLALANLVNEYNRADSATAPAPESVPVEQS